MMRKPPKWVHGFADRHGKARWYFRRPGFCRTPLPGLPWSPEFMAAYEAALGGIPKPIAKERVASGSLHALALLYYASADFQTLRPSTRSIYRGIIEGMRERYGDLPLARIERRHIVSIIGKRAETPTAANAELKIWRLLMRCALEADLIKADPTIGVRKVRHQSEGFRAWTEEDITQFEAAYPIGTRERLALGILLFTAARRSDAVLFGPQHIKAGRLVFRQVKTGGEVNIPVHPELRRVIDASPSGHLTFLVTALGKPFAPVVFTNWFREAAHKAGLPKGCSPHGLRKAAARRLAEAKVTGHGIMAVTGHQSLKEIDRYTAAANRARLADGAMEVIDRPEKAKS